MEKKEIYLQLCPEQLGDIIRIAVRNILIEEKIIKSNEPEITPLDSETINDAEEEIISIKDVAEILKLSRAAIYEKTYKNEIPFIKRGKYMFFKKPEILKLVKDKIVDSEINNNV